MEKEDIINKTKNFVYEKLFKESSGHDWWHVKRVYENAVFIAGNEEGCDTFVIELAALLHDIADWKFHAGDLNKGAEVSAEFLSGLNVDAKTIAHVSDIVKNISFKGANTTNGISTLEGKIVQDADRLDAIGAIGIARTFAYGGFKNLEMYDPETKAVLHNSFEEYKNSKSTTINHFYEKLLLLKDLMNTETAKKMALKRHSFMEKFLKEFFDEWNGTRLI